MEQGNGVGAGQTGAVGGANPMGAEQIVAEQVTVTQVEPAESAEPVTPVEPVAPGSMVAEPKAPKKGHGMLVGLILCLLLAAGGVGFGVWAWMDGNTQKDTLNSQIAELKKQNNELRDKLSSKPEVEEDVTVDVETDSNVNTADYIYVGEWGVKIKIPEELAIVNYSVSESVYGSSLEVAGSKEKVDGSESAVANLENASAGFIMRSNNSDGFYPYGTLVYTDGSGNKYYYSGPQAYPDLSESDLNLWKESQRIIQDMLMTPENYSEI